MNDSGVDVRVKPPAFSPSEDFARADEAIRKRVIALVEELVRKPSL